MKKFLVSLLLTISLCFVAGLYLPWWSVALVSFLIAYLIPLHPGKSFLTGFLSVFVLWSIVAIVLDAGNDHILSVKVASILPLNGSYILLILIGSVIGAIVAAFAALSGALLRKARP